MILFILDIKKSTKYFVCSFICLVISFIYSKYSHGVSSIYMTYLFVIPLIGGIINSFIKGNNIFNNTFPSSILTFSIYSLLMGIFEIAGTDSNYMVILIILGIIMLVISLLSLLKKQK